MTLKGDILFIKSKPALTALPFIPFPHNIHTSVTSDLHIYSSINGNHPIDNFSTVLYVSTMEKNVIVSN